MRWLRVAAPLAAYVALAVIVALYPDNAIDRAISTTLQRADVLDPLFRAASWPGNHVIAVVVPAAAIAGLLALRARRDAAYLALSVLGATGLGQLTRWIVDRPRPAAPVRTLVRVTGASFPSGHVTEYVALFGMLAVIAAARVSNAALRRAAIAACALLVVAIGPSRIYLGAHWPSDAAGGYLIGAAWLAAAAQRYRAGR